MTPNEQRRRWEQRRASLALDELLRDDRADDAFGCGPCDCDIDIYDLTRKVDWLRDRVVELMRRLEAAS